MVFRARRGFLAGAMVFLVAFLALWTMGRPLWVPIYYHLMGKQTVEDVLTQLGPQSRARLVRRFDAAGVAYPPRAVALLGIKEAKALELWAADSLGWHSVATYPVLAASGGPGPKLREGDLQVPEGMYGIEGLNPNSAFHLSMKLDYPNAWDREQAARDGRSNLGGDIFIHGKSASIGCLAVGDEAIEELFVLAADLGRGNVQVILAPTDLRAGPAPVIAGAPSWLPELYRDIARALEPFQKGP